MLYLIFLPPLMFPRLLIFHVLIRSNPVAFMNNLFFLGLSGLALALHGVFKPLHMTYPSHIVPLTVYSVFGLLGLVTPGIIPINFFSRYFTM
jgi:hypothetical protein